VWLDAYPVDGDYAAAIERFAEELSRQGVQVDRLRQGPVDATASWDIYLDLLFGVIGSGSPEAEVAAYQAAGRDAPQGSLASRLALATAQPLRQWVMRSAQQERLRAQWAQFFNGYDLLLCPVSLASAFPHKTDDG